jgi:heme/copper-type cytochrome/quinol oxidase subunit 2
MTPASILACAACFAANVESPLVDGAKSGVWLLLTVTLGVQGAFATFFIQLWRRARKARQEEIATEWSELQRRRGQP